MRRMKGWILAALLCLLAAWSVGQAVLGGERPFRDLEGADITAASVALFPPGRSLEVPDREALAGLLREVVVYGEDPSWRDMAGQTVLFSLSMADGREVRVTAFSPYLVVDGTGYRTKEGPCEALEAYANGLLDG